ncbi:MAG: thiol protease/hemagglutinin PrtT [Porphyromonadaceae bacterium]|nr:thiol protease/hemagglutinin PrtT [Porphyromonadaceae bacterium]
MKMNFYLSLLLWLSIGWSAMAGPVGRRDALRIASRFVQVDQSSELRSAAAEEVSGETRSYYIFNDVRKQGFVIVSGDDNLPEIIGYSDRGHVDIKNMPIQLSTLLKYYQRRVEQLRAVSTDVAINRSQAQHRRYPKTIVGPLVKSLWNQDAPYNGLTPSRGNQHAPTGCVATAMAQVMYFHKWPKQGEGANSYQPQYRLPSDIAYYYPKQERDFSKSVYDWDNMQDTYRKQNGQDNWSADAAKAVAVLMRDAGVAVNMGYTPSESGALVSDAERALRNNFGYDTQSIIRDSSDEDFVLTSLKKEFDSGFPVLMTGAGGLGGHAWVIDGYDENGYIHVNWGWGGLSDGYYELNFMDPKGLGIGGGGGKFNQNQFFILTRPRGKSGVKPMEIQPRLSFPQSSMTIRQGQTDWQQKKIEIEYAYAANLSIATYTGRCGVALYNAKEEQIRVFRGTADIVHSVKMFEYFPSQTRLVVDLSGLELVDGVYTLRAVCQEVDDKTKQDKGAWVPIGAGNRIEIEAVGGALSLISDGRQPRFSLTTKPQEIVRTIFGRSGSTSLGIKNTSSRHVSGSLGIIFTQVGSTTPVDTISTSPIDLYGHADSYRLFTYRVSSQTKVKPGKYNVSFCFVTLPTQELISGALIPSKVYPVSNPYEAYQIEVLADTDLPILEYVDQGRGAFDFYQEGKVLETDVLDMALLKHDKIDIGVELRNFGTDYSGAIRYRLFDMQDNVWIELGQKAGITLKKNFLLKASKTKVRIPFKTLSLKADRMYELRVEALLNQSWVDVWSATNPRRYVSFKNLQSITSAELVSREEALVQVYPNPTHGQLYIAHAPQGALYIEVFDFSGRRLQAQSIVDRASQIDLSAFSAGIYVLRMRSGDNVWVQRVEKRN